MQPQRSPSRGWPLIEVLGERRRREVYELVRARGEMTRDEVAAAAGMTRALAAFHLDKLADAGLLAVSYARPPGRGGPGAGRPAKHYAPAPVDVEVAIPPRRYALAGRILARAVEERGDRAGTRERVLAIAAEEGEAAGAAARPPRRPSLQRSLDVTTGVLADLGFEPEETDDGLRLRNCPFHELVAETPELVCAMNRELVAGVLRGMGAPERVDAVLEPVPGQCCVIVRAHR